MKCQKSNIENFMLSHLRFHENQLPGKFIHILLKVGLVLKKEKDFDFDFEIKNYT